MTVSADPDAECLKALPFTVLRDSKAEAGDFSFYACVVLLLQFVVLPPTLLLVACHLFLYYSEQGGAQPSTVGADTLCSHRCSSAGELGGNGCCWLQHAGSKK